MQNLDYYDNLYSSMPNADSITDYVADTYGILLCVDEVIHIIERNIDVDSYMKHNYPELQEC